MAEEIPITELLNRKVYDGVTGFVGEVTAVCLYAAGPARVQVEALIDGKIVDEWFYVDRVLLADDDE